MVDLHRQYLGIRDEVDRAIGDVIAETAFIKGPAVGLFEEELARRLEVRHCIACGNGTDALLLSLLAVGLQRGDEVIVPAFAFAAVAETVLLLGGYDKHTDFMPLCREIIASGRIDDVVVMGETARQIREQLEEAGYDRITQAYSLRDAVDKARALAVSGGNVLLSPACASFDMFRDYEHRGAVFKEIVNALN